MKILLFILTIVFFIAISEAQGRIDSSWVGDIKITADRDLSTKNKKTIICFFALPNGNSTEWTMGKKMEAGDNWHFDIQHIRAQTEFIRSKWQRKNFIVIYLENKQKSWPAWKQQHTDFKTRLPFLIDSISLALGGKNRVVYLNGHSGGGSLIFGYLSGVERIPSYIKRISFIDSDYGYDSSYYSKLSDWLKNKTDPFNIRRNSLHTRQVTKDQTSATTMPIEINHPIFPS